MDLKLQRLCFLLCIGTGKWDSTLLKASVGIPAKNEMIQRCKKLYTVQYVSTENMERAQLFHKAASLSLILLP
jgi:hypothetical protein